MKTNFTGTFLFCREAARLMQLHGYGRIVNFTSVAVPLKIEGEAAYAASKAAVISLTQMPEVAEVSVYGGKTLSWARSRVQQFDSANRAISGSSFASSGNSAVNAFRSFRFRFE
jgi:hypothetical protein